MRSTFSRELNLLSLLLTVKILYGLLDLGARYNVCVEWSGQADAALADVFGMSFYRNYRSAYETRIYSLRLPAPNSRT